MTRLDQILRPIWPIKPGILPELMAEMELFGADGMRTVLDQARLDTADRSRNALIRFGNVVAKRGEIHDWLKWKSSCDSLWVKAGVLLAFIGAVAAIIAAAEGWPSAK